MVERLLFVVDRLEQFPRSGRVVPEFKRPNLREVLHRNYRIVYRLRDDSVEIITVFRSAKLLSVPEEQD